MASSTIFNPILNNPGGSTDPLTALRAIVAAAGDAYSKLSGVSGQTPAESTALSSAMQALQNITTQAGVIDVGLQGYSDQVTALSKQVADLTTALQKAQTDLAAANSKLAQVPKTADGKPAKPGMYFSAPAVGAIAIGLGLVGAIGGYWYRGTVKSAPKALKGRESAGELGAGESTEDEIDEPAATKNRRKR